MSDIEKFPPRLELAVSFGASYNSDCLRAEGSSEHGGIDLVASHSQSMFDWVAEIFGGRVKAT